MFFSNEVFKELRVDSHLSVFTSVGIFPDLLELLSEVPVVLSHSVALLLHYHATDASGIPVPQVTA